jgi:hypothetical protein
MSFAGLDAWLRLRSDADLFSGVVLIRRGDATLFAGAYGWASRRWAVPVLWLPRFDTASITKLLALLRSGGPGMCRLTRVVCSSDRQSELGEGCRDAKAWQGVGDEFVVAAA